MLIYHTQKLPKFVLDMQTSEMIIEKIYMTLENAQGTLTIFQFALVIKNLLLHRQRAERKFFSQKEALIQVAYNVCARKLTKHQNHIQNIFYCHFSVDFKCEFEMSLMLIRALFEKRKNINRALW